MKKIVTKVALDFENDKKKILFANVTIKKK